MIQAIAIDDEPLALKVIEQFCVKLGSITLIKTFTSATEAIRFLLVNEVDLLFLDINMPMITGVDFYQKLSHKPPLIFTTAHAQYAVDGFNLNAVDYLLKPFSYKRFEQAIEKVKAISFEKDRQKMEEFISIRADYSLVKIPTKDILLVESLDNYIKVHLQNDKPILARMTLKNMISLLPANQFLQIHRSYVVPINNIKTIRNKVLYYLDFALPIGSSYEKVVMEFMKP